MELGDSLAVELALPAAVPSQVELVAAVVEDVGVNSQAAPSVQIASLEIAPGSSAPCHFACSSASHHRCKTVVSWPGGAVAVE